MDITPYFDITNYIGSWLETFFIIIAIVVASIIFYFIIFLWCMIWLNRKLWDIRELLRQHNEILEANSKTTLNKETEITSEKNELDS